MKKENSVLEWIAILIIGIILGVLVTFYGVFVINKLVVWFNIPVHLNFSQWFGLLGIISIILPKQKTDKIDEEEFLSTTIKSYIERVSILSVVLGIYYIIKFFI